MSSEKKSEERRFLEISSSDSASATVVAENLQRDLTVLQSTFADGGAQQAKAAIIHPWPVSIASNVLPSAYEDGSGA
jgi:hypothetical protein